MSSGFTKLEVVFRDATDPILIEDLDGIVIDMNEQAVRTYGFAREELIGQPIKTIVPPERHSQADELLALCRSGEQVRDVEGVRITKAGKRVPVLLSLSLLKDDTGAATAVATFAKDITSLRQSEAEAKRLSRVFMDAADPMVIEDLSGNVINLNREAERAYGWQRDDLIGKPIKLIVPQERYGQADDLLKRCLSGEEVRNVEGLRSSRSGEVFDVLITLSLLFDENRQPMGIASIAKDIGPLRAAEEENRQLTRVFRDAADPILLEDLDGVVFDLNTAAERLYGWAREELVGKPIKTIVPESRHSQADEILAQCKAGEEVRNVEGLRITRDGTELPVLITLSLLKDEAGQPTGVASFAKEITAQKQAEAELRTLAEQLEVRVEARTEEIEQANRRLSHELAVARELSDAADRQHQLWLQGESIAARALRESIEVHADSDDPVLLTGPNGSGQEAVARAIHRISPRSGHPFIYVACSHASIADDTIFGLREDGSDETSPGKMALADGGTLYLEGIETLSRSAQENLFKGLRDTANQRADGRQPEPDVRLIACAAIDLSDAIRQGDFDSELARVLGTRRLAVPSLAERRDDVISLANSVVADRARSLGKAIDGLNPESEERLLRYSWPGNLDELQNVVERAVVLATGTSVDIPEDLLREGRRVGGYTLERQLGSGGMGEVWLARHALLARPSAVKLIRQQALEADSKAREMLEQRFQREAQATSQLRSPHTVELYDFGVTEDRDFYYVMEYLNGVDLESLVTKSGPVDPARAVFFLCQACMSLGEAHAAGLVHRDVKPANLFACRLGLHYDFLKLLDFGIVKTTGHGGQTVTVAGQLKGTPTSISPEVVQGEQAGFLSDIYALGCVAYWLLSGKHVFEGATVMATLVQHVSQPPKPLSEHRSDLPGELSELVLSCLAKNPADRPKSAFELGKRLASIPLVDSWDQRRAEAWWHENMPDIKQDATTASIPETMVFDSGDTE